MGTNSTNKGPTSMVPKVKTDGNRICYGQGSCIIQLSNGTGLINGPREESSPSNDEP